MNAPKEINHAEQNAKAWAESIAEMVAALDCDYNRLEELEDQRADLCQLEGPQDAAALAQWDEENGDELAELRAAATVDGEQQESAEKVRERIEESPLSVEVRSGWYTPGGECEPEDFAILLSTGGPALRVRGELDGARQPCRAWLEYQDWGTPWTQYFNVEQDTLVRFASCFYFGE